MKRSSILHCLIENGENKFITTKIKYFQNYKSSKNQKLNRIYFKIKFSEDNLMSIIDIIDGMWVMQYGVIIFRLYHWT